MWRGESGGCRALEVWRTAQRQMEVEQSEAFDHGTNSGYQAEVQLHR